jgi:predicted Zn-dependent peptidase
MLFKGTKHRTAKMLADDMARIGGTMNAYTSKDCTTFYVTTLDYHLPFAIEMIADMLCNSLLAPADIEKEKEVILEEIDMYNDSPEDLVHEMLQNNVWKDHPLGYIISGSREIVNGITREQIVSYMEQFYVSENIVISIAGNFKEEQVINCLETHFSSIHQGGKQPEITNPIYYKSLYQKPKDMEQVHMNIAFDCIDYSSDEKYVLSVVNAILGGSENSRLFQVIREELGLVYSICSYGSSFQTAGLFHIDVVLNPSKQKVVYDTIFHVINSLQENGISEEELFRTKEQIKTELIIGNESTRNRMSSNGKALLSIGKIIPLDETIQSLQAVTLEDVNAFMKHYLQKENSSLSLVGNLPKDIKL